MQISTDGIKLVKAFESLKLQAYQDEVGVWTIGYGHIEQVASGQTITAEVAEEFLKEDLAWAEDAVNRYVKIPLEQHQFDSLVSLVFNIGSHAFADSTFQQLLKYNKPEYIGGQFCRWIMAGKKISNGLVMRRGIEGKVYHDGYQPAVVEWIARKT